MKTILYIVEDTEPAQFRYRVENVAEVMEESSKYRVKWFKRSEIGQAEKMLDEVDFVVILRQTAKDKVILDFIEKAHAQGVNVLFDLDDLIFDYRYLPLMMWSTYAKNIFFWAGYYWGVRRIAKKMDGFITTNEFLRERLEKTFGKPCGVIRNSLNKKQVEVAGKCLENKRKEGKDFRIGYFSGSPTHEKDLEVALPAVMQLMEKYKNVKLEVVGYMKFHGEAKKYYEKGRVTLRPLVDYKKLEELMAGVDVNIAPLVVNDFTNCKSELKFFEAGVVETTTIASPTYTFKQAIKDGENGFLAQPEEWYDKLEYLYEHSEENRKIAKQARKDALKHYYGKEFLQEVERVYDGFAKLS